MFVIYRNTVDDAHYIRFNFNPVFTEELSYEGLFKYLHCV